MTPSPPCCSHNNAVSVLVCVCGGVQQSILSVMWCDVVMSVNKHQVITWCCRSQIQPRVPQAFVTSHPEYATHLTWGCLWKSNQEHSVLHNTATRLYDHIIPLLIQLHCITSTFFRHDSVITFKALNPIQLRTVLPTLPPAPSEAPLNSWCASKCCWCDDLSNTSGSHRQKRLKNTVKWL